MVVCFGISWPLSIGKSYRARSTKGKSLVFLCFVFSGYCCGIAAKFISANTSYVLLFYTMNAAMVAADIAVYYRNRRIERGDGANGGGRKECA